MARCKALYSHVSRMRHPRAALELERDRFLLTLADGRWRGLHLHGARFFVRDASYTQRFVRHLALWMPEGRADLITPPDEGAIAPRAAGLPVVPEPAIVLEAPVWEAAVEWMRGGGRLGGRTVGELARIACIATAQFAIAIGEWAAEVAAEMSWERVGPMRSGGDMRHSLRPLHEAARRSPRAADALTAAMARSSALVRRAG
jgi:hypothetical protein